MKDKRDDDTNMGRGSTDLTPETTVACPWHDLPLQIQTENRLVDGKTIFVRFAVCNCRVEDNSHMGQRAWEQT